MPHNSFKLQLHVLNLVSVRENEIRAQQCMKIEQLMKWVSHNFKEIMSSLCNIYFDNIKNSRTLSKEFPHHLSSMSNNNEIVKFPKFYWQNESRMNRELCSL